MSESQLSYVQRKTRRRIGFTLVHLALYFSFTLNWTPWGEWLRGSLGGGPMTGSILMFVLLVASFIGLELLFIFLGREDQQ